MYISKVKIRNFRVFNNNGTTADFKRGVNAIIGENNCGKSAMIDAIRIAFSTSMYRKDIYFNNSDFHVDIKGVRSNEATFDIYFNEVPPDLFEIWNPEDNNKGEFHVQYFTVKTDGSERIRFRIWGGPDQGNILTSETLEAINLTYLGALRDADFELKPSKNGKLAKLFSSLVKTDESKRAVVDIFKQVNSKIESQESFKKVVQTINANLSVLEQDILKQHIGVGLIEPKFESIAGSLRAWLNPRWIFLQKDNTFIQRLEEIFTIEEWQSNIKTEVDGIYFDIWSLENKEIDDDLNIGISNLFTNKFEIVQNGLGYNNLLFMATVLGDIETEISDNLFSLLLVEEPEAHLHPQLQELVHSFFESNSSNVNVQVIYTTHSPTLVSRIGIDKLVLLYENNQDIDCLTLSNSKLDSKDKFYLERFLDVTKSQMLFAKGIIFVEGVCEALVIPCLADLLNKPLYKYAVTVVNVDGVSFEPFANLLCHIDNPKKKTINSVIITDDDRCTDKNDELNYISKDYDFDCPPEIYDSIATKLDSGKPSERFNKIKELCLDAHIKIQSAPKTFEYALSFSLINIQYLLSAIIDTYPRVGYDLFDKVESLNNISKKSICIWLFMRSRSKAKAEIAQALSRRIIEKKIYKKKDTVFYEEEISDIFQVPEYIKNAIIAVTN